MAKEREELSYSVAVPPGDGPMWPVRGGVSPQQLLVPKDKLVFGLSGKVTYIRDNYCTNSERDAPLVQSVSAESN